MPYNMILYFCYFIFMSLILLYFLHSSSVLSFYIDVVLTLSIECCGNKLSCRSIYLDNKVHGANMGPTWVLLAPGGSHVSPTNLAVWVMLRPWYHERSIPIYNAFLLSEGTSFSTYVVKEVVERRNAGNKTMASQTVALTRTQITRKTIDLRL